MKSESGIGKSREKGEKEKDESIGEDLEEEGS